MSGSAGLSPSRNRKREDSTLSEYARNLRKECADLAAGQAVLTVEFAAFWYVPFSLDLSLRSYPVLASMRFGAHLPVHPRLLRLAGCGYAPSCQSRRESAGKSPAPPRQTLLVAPASASDFHIPRVARPARQISCRRHGRPGIRRGSTLRRPPNSVQSSESLLVSSVTPYSTRVSHHY